MADFTIKYISGMNNSDPSNLIPEDQAESAVNVEFWDSALGERRAGCEAVDVPAAFTGNANIQIVSFLHRHIPDATTETGSELWALGQHLTTQNYSLQRKTSVWNTVTPDLDIEVTSGLGYTLNAASFRGKLHFAYKNTSDVDRSMVWDGTDLRKTGLAEPAAPTAAETGAGTFSGIRYYRVRYTRQNGSGVTILRSEPSDSVTYNPATFGNNGASARVTKPATISEDETHWELEASLNNADFYRIATTAVATTTYDDSTAFATGYAAFTLSEETGAYSLPHSAKFVIVDEDRVLWLGSHEDTTKASRVVWSPVFGAPGAGNDERWDATTDPFLDLDSHDGGEITHVSKAINGQIWVFKRTKTYLLVRTGQRDRAYNSIKISDTVGALPKSAIQGVNELGEPCLYFLDPKLGPCRTGGRRQIQSCGKDIITTWESVNLNANVVARVVFYPKKQQVIWDVAFGDLDTTSPNLGIVLHIGNTSEQADGVRGGWAIWTGTICAVYASALYSDNVNEVEDRNLDLVPIYGVSAADGYILIGDTGTTDNEDEYLARILTKPFILRGLLNKFGVMSAALLAEPDADATIKITLHRDFGLEEPRTTTTDIAASASETQVIKQLRELNGGQMYALQVEFEDPDPATGQWKLNRFDMRLENQERA